MATSHLIDVLEAAYSLDGTEQQWVEGIAKAAHPVLPRGSGGVVVFTHRVTPDQRVEHGHFAAVGAPDGILEFVAALQRRATPRQVSATVGQDAHCSTLSESTGDQHIVAEFGEPFGVRDVLGVNAINPCGRGCTITVGLPEVTRVSPRFKWNWTRVAAHLAAALRLRGQYREPPALDDGDAVFTPEGRVEHLTERTRSPRNHDALRHAALAMDRARLQRSRDGTSAIDLWRALVAGEWSLIDRFDSDGRRYLVAHQNAPEVADPRALTRRERQVVALATFGHSSKLISYELGLSQSVVSRHLRSALRKLGLDSRAELQRSLRPAGSAQSGA